MKGVKKEHPLPKLGSKHERKWREKIYEMSVIKEDGTIKFMVNGKKFSSPSGAAKHITKQAVNGWRFWHLTK
jgi:hypothetical protein